MFYRDVGSLKPAVISDSYRNNDNYENSETIKYDWFLMLI